MTLAFTVGDTLPALAGQITNAGSGANMVGTTARAHIRRNDATILDVPVVWTDAATGRWAYLGGANSTGWAVGDLNIAGTWTVEIQVTFANGDTQTFGPTQFPVKGQLA